MTNESKVVSDLRRLLANTYALYTKTQNFHWNITGEHFFALHLAFEKQYEELSEAVDELAERIRALNQYAPGTFEQFMKLSSIKSDSNIPDSQAMIRELLENHEQIINELQQMIKNADEEGDEATMDLMIERQAHHQKTAWMLRSSLARG